MWWHPRDARVLIPVTYAYVRLHGKNLLCKCDQVEDIEEGDFPGFSAGTQYYRVLTRGKQESQSEKLEIQQKQEIRVEEGRGDKAGTSKS